MGAPALRAVESHTPAESSARRTALRISVRIDEWDQRIEAMRYASKQALLADIRAEHDSLCARLSEIPKARWREPGVWGDAWTLSDLVAHLAEWQHMLLGWHADGLRGVTPEMPAPGFKWSETPRLNRAIWKKHRSRSHVAILAEFESGYGRIVRLVEALSPRELLEPGHFAWTGRHPLTTYIGPNTASHYRFALKAIKRWMKAAPVSGSSAARSRVRARPTKARSRSTPKTTARRRPSGRSAARELN